MALTAGTTLAEHETPGEATVHVLSGQIRLSAGDVSWECRAGDLLVVPPQRDDLAALEDPPCCSPSPSGASAPCR